MGRDYFDRCFAAASARVVIVLETSEVASFLEFPKTEITKKIRKIVDAVRNASGRPRAKGVFSQRLKKSPCPHGQRNRYTIAR